MQNCKCSPYLCDISAPLLLPIKEKQGINLPAVGYEEDWNIKLLLLVCKSAGMFIAN